jgi:hypothetical protein
MKRTKNGHKNRLKHGLVMFLRSTLSTYPQRAFDFMIRERDERDDLQERPNRPDTGWKENHDFKNSHEVFHRGSR